MSYVDCNEKTTPIFDADLLIERYDECLLNIFFEYTGIGYDDLNFLDNEDIFEIFGKYILENINIEDYLQSRSNFYSILRKLPKDVYKNLIKDYCYDKGIAHSILENDYIVFNWNI